MAALAESSQEIKKVLRRQGVTLELLDKKLTEGLEAVRTPGAEALWDLAEGFFYLSKSLDRWSDLSDTNRQSLEMVWKKIAALLQSGRLELIREIGVPYDPRRHESVAPWEDGEGKPTVKEIIMPGRCREGRVIRPAKVTLEAGNGR
ncbi:MAG: nucleotide exchange factor GrpE [Deltaproteobacteria bacterium]|nr:nucleotide exchange factor GrpE [Deltaproteobacteria bacterium]